MSPYAGEARICVKHVTRLRHYLLNYFEELHPCLEWFPLDLTRMLRHARPTGSGLRPARLQARAGHPRLCRSEKDVDGRDIRAFTPVFDGLCPAMTE